MSTDQDMPRKPKEITWVNLVTVFKVALALVSFFRSLKKTV